MMQYKYYFLIMFIEMRLGNFESSKKHGQNLLKLIEENPAKLRNRDIDIKFGLGRVLTKNGEYQASATLLEGALADAKTQLGDEHPTVENIYSSIGSNYVMLGKSTEAYDYINKSLQLATKRLGPRHFNIAPLIHNLGMIELRENKYAAARKKFLEALSIEIEQRGETNPSLVVLYTNIGRSYLGEKNYLEAMKIWDKCLAILSKMDAKNADYQLNNIKRFKSTTIVNIPGREEEAFQLAKEVYESRKDKYGEIHAETAHSLNLMASAQWHLKNYSKAIKLGERAESSFRESKGTSHPDYLTILWPLFRTYLDADQKAKVESTTPQVLELLSNEKTRERLIQPSSIRS